MGLPDTAVWWHGAVTRRQLLAEGVPADTIDSWLRRGRLSRVLPSVYARGPVTLLTKTSAALLWLPSAAASHRTAAWLWQLADEPTMVEVTAPRGCSRRSPVSWLRVYRRDLPIDRIELWDRLPTVEPEQTALDCLAVMDRATGIRMVDAALGRQLRQERLRDRYLTNLGRRGSPVAARVLRQAIPGAASHPERVLARALRAAGLDGFRVNRPVRGYVADLLDEERRLIVEVDGWATRGSRPAFQSDRVRQNVLVAAGYTVLRYTADDIEHRLAEVVGQIRSVVAGLDRRK